jgi:hypothetical protein
MFLLAAAAAILQKHLSIKKRNTKAPSVLLLTGLTLSRVCN